MKTWMMGLVVAGAAMLGGCAVYPAYPGYGAGYGGEVAVAPAPVYAAPAVVVSPSYYGYYGGYGGYGRRYRYWR